MWLPGAALILLAYLFSAVSFNLYRGRQFQNARHRTVLWFVTQRGRWTRAVRVYSIFLVFCVFTIGFLIMPASSLSLASVLVLTLGQAILGLSFPYFLHRLGHTPSMVLLFTPIFMASLLAAGWWTGSRELRGLGSEKIAVHIEGVTENKFYFLLRAYDRGLLLASASDGRVRFLSWEVLEGFSEPADSSRVQSISCSAFGICSPFF